MKHLRQTKTKTNKEEKQKVDPRKISAPIQTHQMRRIPTTLEYPSACLQTHKPTKKRLKLLPRPASGSFCVPGRAPAGTAPCAARAPDRCARSSKSSEAELGFLRNPPRVVGFKGKTTGTPWRCLEMNRILRSCKARHGVGNIQL